jgi:dihydroflavonol-4-reductase
MTYSGETENTMYNTNYLREIILMKDTVFLLTGAAGFLGSNVSRALIAGGQKVRALILKGDPAVQYIPPEVELVYGNLLDKDSLAEFFDIPLKSEAIVLHIASFVTVVPDWNQKVYDVNVTGTQNIIDKCLEHRVKKLVYVSSTGAVTELPHGQAIAEPAVINPDLVRGCYSKTKAQATNFVFDAVRNKGLDASVVYPSGICGPNDFAYGFVARFIMDYVAGKMPAGVAGSFNSVDVRDLADAVISCADKGRKGEGYILSNDFITIADIFRLIHIHTGVPEVKTILPLGVARVMAFFTDITSKITGKPAQLTSFSIYNLSRNNNFSSEKARQELGFKTRAFEETIADTIKWLMQEGKISVNDCVRGGS